MGDDTSDLDAGSFGIGLTPHAVGVMPQCGADVRAGCAASLLPDAEFARQWMMGLASEGILGRPREWDGREAGFDSFAFRFSNWLSAMPGDAEELMEASAQRPTPVLSSEFGARLSVIAKGVMQASMSSSWARIATGM